MKDKKKFTSPEIEITVFDAEVVTSNESLDENEGWSDDIR